jgi:hypothetical protein
MHTNVFLAIAVVLAACPAANGGDPPKVDPDVARLVQDLGSPRFAAREAAERKLAELGSKAKAAVLASTKNADLEVARRCEAVLPKIRATERKALVDGTGGWPVPAGTRFKELVGDTKESRTLFALMTEDDRRAESADAAAADPTRATRLYAAEVTRLGEAQQRVMKAFRGEFPLDWLREDSRAAIPTGEVALGLYLGALTPAGAADPPDATDLFVPAFRDLAAGPEKGPFGKLFVAWLGGRDPKAMQAGLHAALAAGVPSAVGPARRLVADRTAEGPVIGAAVLVLGRLGTREDLASLSALRDDRREYNAAIGSSESTQVRDLAAAASLTLRGQKFWRYGFDQLIWLVWWADPVVVPAMLPSDAARAAALKKAWDWLDQQPGAPPKPAK